MSKKNMVFIMTFIFIILSILFAGEVNAVDLDVELLNAEVSVNGKTTIFEYNSTIDTNAECPLTLTEYDLAYGNGTYVEKQRDLIIDNKDFVKNEGYIETEKTKIKVNYKMTVKNNDVNPIELQNLIAVAHKEYDDNLQIDGETINRASGNEHFEKNTIGEIIDPGMQREFYVSINMREHDPGYILSNGNKLEKGGIAAMNYKFSVEVMTADGISVSKEAPVLKVTRNWNSRTISGCVWDDTENINGTIDSNENKIENIIVQLIEIKEESGTKKYYIWDQEVTNSNGEYKFKNIVPGNYIVRFVYGTENTDYNGQDYKSTIDLNYYNYKDGKWYNEYLNDAVSESVARDNEARRLDTIANTMGMSYDITYGINNNINYGIGSGIGKALNTKIDNPAWKYKENTYMYADTSKISVPIATSNGQDTGSVDGWDMRKLL